MATPLYLGVEGVLIHQNDRAKGARRRFEMTQYGLTFLEWVIEGFNCYWLTSLDHHGGDHRIRRAFAIALGYPTLPSEFDLLFEFVQPTYWENAMVETIPHQSHFYWIASDPDAASLKALERRGLKNRLILSSTLDSPDDIARLQVQLESAYL